MIVFHNLLVIDVVFSETVSMHQLEKKAQSMCGGIVGFKLHSICYLVSIYVTMATFRMTLLINK
jgi:hypothetical protein